MGGIMEMFDVLYAILPRWAVFALVGIGMLCIAPSWYRWVQNKKVKGLLRNYASTTNREMRIEIEGKLWMQVGQSTGRLTVCAQTAHEMGLIHLCRKAEERLQRLGSPIPHRGVKPDKKQTPGPLHPIEVSVRVAQLLEQGLVDPAQDLLNTALKTHPNDPDLQAAVNAIDAAHASKISQTPEMG